ncbi:MAG TPA: 4-hydroxy-tetrahydrodipicolinate reductase [Clostridiales bacterium]|nr:4-hydroxy-tetrahydrodipicolinate reductase [Clostridiales bacterium]
MIDIIIHGCNGTMGQVVANTAISDSDINIVAGIDMCPQAKDNPFPTYDSLDECEVGCDVIVDFSRHDAVVPMLSIAAQKKIPVVIATTGISDKDKSFIEEKSDVIPIFMASNMSVGVNLMYELIRRSATALSDDFDIEIIEKHHNQKIDSPSGTAYTMAHIINEVFSGRKHFSYGRHSQNAKRSKDEIGIHAIRGGTIVGEHSVLFAGVDEILEIKHTAYSKQIFAVGALKAAKFLKAVNKPGLYDMTDMMAHESLVTSVYTEQDIAMITLNSLPNSSEIIAKIFKALGEHNINIDMISQTAPVNSRINISFTLPEEDLNKAIEITGPFNTQIPELRTDVFAEICKITVEGLGMEKYAGVAGDVFSTMAKNNINIKIITTSETKISFIIDAVDESKAVQAIKDTFNL